MSQNFLSGNTPTAIDTRRVVQVKILNRLDTASPLPPPFVYDPEVWLWEAAIVAGGFTLPQATKDAADTLMKAIKAVSGLRAKLLRMNLYAGTPNNSDVFLIPIIHDVGTATDVKTGTFTTWTYTETGAGGGAFSSGGDILSAGGVNGNDASMGTEDMHLGYYATTSGVGIHMGAGQTGAGAAIPNSNNGNANAFMYSILSPDITVADPGNTGHYVVTRSGTATLYKNGASIGSNATPGGARPASPIYVHNASLDGVAWGGAATMAHIATYHYGKHLLSTDVSSLNTALQTFQTALSRNV